MSRPNFVIIITDTQNKSMVGAYGCRGMNTPNLDRLADSGIRFERAYTACPLCTPARGSIFSGFSPQCNGAWSNELLPQPHIPLMGTIFRNAGYRAAYSGKWHLDEGDYFGTGKAGGGFEPDWWYDGRNYEKTLGGKERLAEYSKVWTLEDLRRGGFDKEENIFGYQVANQAVRFLDEVKQDDPFVMVASFDEPHNPYVAPPQWWENFDPSSIPKPINWYASLQDKPRMQQVHFEQCWKLGWPEFLEAKKKHFGCNSYIDTQIGRVIDAVDRRHAKNTYIIYTSDHGDMLGAHGLHSKGPMMYEEITNIPFIVRTPDGKKGVSHSLINHMDIMPTMLELAGAPATESHGKSFSPVLKDLKTSTRQHSFTSFHRYGLHSQYMGAFYPIRSVTDGRYKLSINLLETDEFYDLKEDPGEMKNRINDPSYKEIRNQLHEVLLKEMEGTSDPFQNSYWGERPWNTVREPLYKKVSKK